MFKFFKKSPPADDKQIDKPVVAQDEPQLPDKLVDDLTDTSLAPGQESIAEDGRATAAGSTEDGELAAGTEQAADPDPTASAEATTGTEAMDVPGVTNEASKEASKTDEAVDVAGGTADLSEEGGASTSAEAPLIADEVSDAAPQAPATGGFFSRLRQGLSRTRANLAEGLTALVGGRKTIDADLLDEVETQLLMADVGIEATEQVINVLTTKLKRKQLKDGDALMENLKAELRALLDPCTAPLQIQTEHKPYVILVVGVNGVGKTTTIGKLAHRFKQDNHKVMLAAGDTFRAAAVEQLQTWGERNDVPVIAQATGSDSASVIFDAYQAAKARGRDVLLADTAGRLHNKANLMEELAKIVRVLKKQDESLPHEVLLVLDATTGQNALNQAKSFNDAIKLTGLCLTKLDGTAKGGVVFSIAKAMQLPIRFIGVGEKAEDLRPFDADEFVSALFERT